MEKKSEKEITTIVDHIHKSIQPALYEKNTGSSMLFDQFERTEKGLNEKILEITLQIRTQYPELSKYLEEMPVTIPVDQHPAVNIEKLKAYYDSLNALLVRYILMNPHHGEAED